MDTRHNPSLLIGLERKCSRCGEYWPADTEFFYFQPSASGGLNCYCHDCYRSVTGRQPGQRLSLAHMAKRVKNGTIPAKPIDKEFKL